MSTTLKTITVGSILALAAISVAILLRSEATAQPPTTIRTVAAAPQGEWVALHQGELSAGGGTSSNMVRTHGFTYVVLFHTGTGKSRIIKWSDRDSISDYKSIDVP